MFGKRGLYQEIVFFKMGAISGQICRKAKATSDCDRLFSFLVLKSMIVFGSGFTIGVVRNGCNKRLGRIPCPYRKYMKGCQMYTCKSLFISHFWQLCSIKPGRRWPGRWFARGSGSSCLPRRSRCSWPSRGSSWRRGTRAASSCRAGWGWVRRFHHLYSVFKQGDW